MAIGTISFQSNDKMDVFHVAQVVENGIEASDEALLNVEDSQFDSDKAWVTGNVPKIKPVNIEGDTATIYAWFKGEQFDKPFVLMIYVECELAEELQEVIADEKIEEEKRQGFDYLEPMEINL
jgi:hypothetical protein